MAKRAKQAAAVAVDVATETPHAPQISEVIPLQAPELSHAAKIRPTAEPPARKFKADPYPSNTVDLEGYKLQLQENLQRRQMQIKFGDGSLNDKPSDDILDFVKAPEGRDGVKFHWNDDDRAWGMRIDPEAPRASRIKAEQVFKEVVKRVAEDKGIGREL
jgi:hypothetical protein